MTPDPRYEAMVEAAAEVLWRDYEQEHEGSAAETFDYIARAVLAAAQVPELLAVVEAAEQLDWEAVADDFLASFAPEAADRAREIGHALAALSWNREEGSDG